MGVRVGVGVMDGVLVGRGVGVARLPMKLSATPKVRESEPPVGVLSVGMSVSEMRTPVTRIPLPLLLPSLVRGVSVWRETVPLVGG